MIQRDKHIAHMKLKEFSNNKRVQQVPGKLTKNKKRNR